MWRPTPYAGLLLGLAIATVAVGGCTGAAPTPGPPEFPLVACRLDAPGAPTAPPGYMLVASGTIAFTQDAWQTLSTPGSVCGAQAVRDASSTFELSTLGGEDRILWAATLARPGQPSTPDPVPPTVTLYRLDAAGPVVVSTIVWDITGWSEQYRMMGNYGHDARLGSYLMRISSGDGKLLAEGRFEIVP